MWHLPCLVPATVTHQCLSTLSRLHLLLFPQFGQQQIQQDRRGAFVTFSHYSNIWIISFLICHVIIMTIFCTRVDLGLLKLMTKKLYDPSKLLIIGFKRNILAALTLFSQIILSDYLTGNLVRAQHWCCWWPIFQG